ncbi:MAG: zf-TFIIB domain-containing protein [Deltaproteobacteria bacterium]|jgi:Zn-finger nucleic acid-binding protein|nr:zf-TFIIB domain-containing protein [Deltaproteobacteria bacterium]MBW2536289.1 zf-TFIIB domain-containing protein [Deltaproteobacteria bacterium]
MQERGPAEARVDVCRGCGGVWLDWFDGEATVLARAVQQAGIATTGAAGRPTDACPRCHSELGVERFGGDGPEVLRCGDCQGLFLSDEAVPLMAALDPARSRGADGPSALDRLVGALRRLLSVS